MPRFGAQVDFLDIPAHRFAIEGSDTPPTTYVVGTMWNDTSIADNAVMKYWDGDEWTRMDGGGDIPNGMIEDRHISETAAIQWSKIAVPDNLATDEDIDALQDSITGLDTRLDTAEDNITGLRTDVDDHESRIAVVEGLTTDINNATQAELDALTTRVDGHDTDITALQSADVALDGRIDAVEAATQDINNATQSELDATNARVTTLESEMDTAQADLDTVESGLAAEIARATAEETDIRADFTAADSGLNDRIDDEIAARQAGDTTNASAISAETTRATSAETALGVRIDGVEDDLASAVSDIEDAAAAETTRVNDALALKADLVGGLVPRDQLPSIALSTVHVVSSISERDELENVDEGDVAVIQSEGGGDDDVEGGAYIWDDEGGSSTSTETIASNDAYLTGSEELTLPSSPVTAEGDGTVILPITMPADGGPWPYTVFYRDDEGGLVSAETGTANAGETVTITIDRSLSTAADPGKQAYISFADDTYVVNVNFSYDEVTNVPGTGGWVLLTLPGGAATDAEINAAMQSLRTEFQDADTALGVRIDTEHDHHVADRAAVEALITTEEAARIAGDETNADAIDAEVTRATTAEGLLDGRITQEVADRIAADTAIRDDLGDDIDAVETALTAEVTRATTAEGVLQGNINTETTARQNADTALGVRIDDVEDDLAAEITRATGAETALGGRVDDVIADLATEVDRAMDAEAAIQTALDAEIDTRENAIIDTMHGGTGVALADKAALQEYLGISTTAGVRGYSETLSAMIEGTEYVVTHPLNTEDIIPSLKNVTTKQIEFADVRVIDATHVGVTVDASYTGGDLRLTLHGSYEIDG